jgi:8-amino-7-oxononanoate synthase
MGKIDARLKAELQRRSADNSLRELPKETQLVDFCSNDYLGFARTNLIKHQNVDQTASTGSRLLTGNSSFAENLEGEIAKFHKSEAALIFNSGYDANLGFFATIHK